MERELVVGHRTVARAHQARKKDKSAEISALISEATPNTKCCRNSKLMLRNFRVLAAWCYIDLDHYLSWYFVHVLDLWKLICCIGWSD